MKKINLRHEARDRECQIRIPGVCCGDNSTVVLCHLNGGGMGRKRDDVLGAWGCATCHSWADGGYSKSSSHDQARLWFLDGMVRTIEILRAEGKL